MFESKIVVRNHSDMIAAAAATLGYMPQESVVLFFFGAQGGPVVRLDAPAPGRMAGFAASMHPLFQGRGQLGEHVVIYVFSDDLTHAQARRLGFDLLGYAVPSATGAEVTDVIRVTSTGWASLTSPGLHGTAEQITEAADLMAWASDERLTSTPQRQAVEPPAYRADDDTAARVAEHRAAYEVLKGARGEDLWEMRHPAGETLAELWERLAAGQRGETVERIAAAMTYPAAVSFFMAALTVEAGNADFELTGLRTLGVPDVPGGDLDVDWSRMRAIRDGLHAVAECTPVEDRAHVFALLGLVYWIGGHGTTAGEWLGMASDVEPTDADGNSRAPLVSLVQMATETISVHPAARNGDNRPEL